MFSVFIRHYCQFMFIFFRHFLLMKKKCVIYNWNKFAILNAQNYVWLKKHKINIKFRNFIKLFYVDNNVIFSKWFFIIQMHNISYYENKKNIWNWFWWSFYFFWTWSTSNFLSIKTLFSDKILNILIDFDKFSLILICIHWFGDKFIILKIEHQICEVFFDYDC